jgi:hypothetical protein
MNAAAPAMPLPEFAESAALLAWEFEGGALCIVTWAASIRALRSSLEQARQRRDMLSPRLAFESYLAADSAVSGLEEQLERELAERRRTGP